jgi:hypothetical protein
MDPDLIKNIIIQRMEDDLSDRFRFRLIKFPYPEERITLRPETVVPSGMSWTDFDGVLKGDGAEEFYGDIHALEGKLEGAEVLVVHGAAVTGTCSGCKELKLIGVLRGGPKNIDVATSTETGYPSRQYSG